MIADVRNRCFTIKPYARAVPFPLSISGCITIQRSVLTKNQSITERLHDALVAQTVDQVIVSGQAIEFVPQTGGGEGKPRPEGGGWMFGMLGRCNIRVTYEPDLINLYYRLSCRSWFTIVTGTSIAAGLTIGFGNGPDHQWSLAFALGIWTLLFLSGYISKTIEFRKWITKNVASDDLLPIKRLRVPADPSS